jgi:lipid-A-disaccharide synthase
MDGLDFLVVAGEASGDVLAAGLISAIRKRRPEARFFGMGGLHAREAGLEILYGADEISVMGIAEVLPKLWRILGVMKGLAAAARERRPQAAILVDIPDFNLRLARKLKRIGIPVIQYVSPMVWAWRKGRVRRMAEFFDEVLCVLPFEEKFLRDRGVKATYVGHPALDQVPEAGPASAMRARLGLPERPTLALLPGSRPSEVGRILPRLLETAALLVAERPDLQFVVPVAPTVPTHIIEGHVASASVKPLLVRGHAPEVVGASDAAIVASGTAVLEAGLMARPLVVVYRVSWLSALFARLLVRVAYVALVNVLAGRRIVPELLQSAMKPRNIAGEVRRLLDDGGTRSRMLADLAEVRRLLGPGGASNRAADEVLAIVDQRPAPKAAAIPLAVTAP